VIAHRSGADAVNRRAHLVGPVAAVRYTLRGWRSWGVKAHRWATSRPRTRAAVPDECADDEDPPDEQPTAVG
jgi:hypothetical protein